MGGGVDLRLNNTTHWYNPNRDLVSQTVQIIRQACEKMTNDLMNKNHAFSGVVKELNIKEEHMAKVAEALAKFVLIASEDGSCPNIHEAVGRSGLLDMPQPVLMVTFSLIAQGLLGRFWDLMRQSALPELIVPMFSKEGLVDSASLMQKVFSSKTTMNMANMAEDMKKWANLPPLK